MVPTPLRISGFQQKIGSFEDQMMLRSSDSFPSAQPVRKMLLLSYDLQLNSRSQGRSYEDGFLCVLLYVTVYYHSTPVFILLRARERTSWLIKRVRKKGL